ncbi:hypothetical protein E5676_scaffold255G009170 [Cucumis melo var. makuwa]|uniref:Uncharacterized protein n=1 Tax=Cucumis melo var. makuwa TaxID=1194695 RepID=A0A5A7UGA5_CUCMM|nr:hypothetical protein E6C27_scaffold120G001300 [Cucumis melo var. makuwa]TYK13296.1 hypothetical protein E5676_scaffold255G009170 [Cucumis melo var. makuwa]
MRSEPESAGLFEERNKRAIDVRRHESFEATEELTTDEHGRDRVRLVGEEMVENGLNIVGGRVRKMIELDNGGTDTKAEEEALDDGAHATAADAENNHRIALRKLPDHLKWPVIG